MSEKEQDILRKLKSALNILPKEKQEYLAGVADGVVMAKDNKSAPSE